MSKKRETKQIEKYFKGLKKKSKRYYKDRDVEIISMKKIKREYESYDTERLNFEKIHLVNSTKRKKDFPNILKGMLPILTFVVLTRANQIKELILSKEPLISFTATYVIIVPAMIAVSFFHILKTDKEIDDDTRIAIIDDILDKKKKK